MWRLFMALFALPFVLFADGEGVTKGALPETDEVYRVLRKGLRYLAQSQRRDGSLGVQYEVAVTSLAGLAFLGSGSTYARGEFSDNIRRAVKFVLDHQDRTGFFAEANFAHSLMHTHGYATLFLTQVYGSGPPQFRRRLRGAIQRAIRVIIRSQYKNGGWGYFPRDFDDWRGDEPELSLTVTQVQALRAARNAGFHIPKRVIKKGVEFIKRFMTKRGGHYLWQGCDWYTLTLQVTGAAVLNSYGLYKPDEEPKLKMALRMVEKALRRELAAGGAGMDAVEWVWYGNLYLAQTCWQAGDALWKLYWKSTFRKLKRLQTQNGLWRQTDPVHIPPWSFEEQMGADYRTAVACLILEIPLSYLPIFQR